MTVDMVSLLRPASGKVHKVGTKVLSSIPDAVAAHTLVDRGSLARHRGLL